MPVLVKPLLTSLSRYCILLVNHIYITSHDKCQLTVGTWCAILDLFIKNTMIQTKKGMGKRWKPFLQVKGFQKLAGTKGIYASHNVTFDVGKGEIFALIGPNGAGKTTTIRMISTLLQATEGDAIVAGHSILTEPDMVRKSITYLPDEAGAYKTMTGREYLEFMASIYADNGEQAYEFVKRGCEICELGDRLNDKISNYSRGMARKLLLARAIMPLPALAILDEPTSGLDIINALEIRRMIRKLASEGMSFLLSSHNMLEIEYVSDRVGIIAKGELLEVKPKPAELI